MSDPVMTRNLPQNNTDSEAVLTEKRVQKVTKDAVKTKRNDVRKFADIFISEDISSVKNYIFMDVLVPAIKKAIYDIVTNGIDMFLYGGTGKGKSGSVVGSKVSYGSFYDNKNANVRRNAEPAKSSGFEYDDLEFTSRGDAEMVLQQMNDAISRYGIVTVADMYDFAGLTAPFTSQKYGWMSVGGVPVVRTRDGYILKLPRAVPID